MRFVSRASMPKTTTTLDTVHVANDTAAVIDDKAFRSSKPGKKAANRPHSCDSLLPAALGSLVVAHGRLGARQSVQHYLELLRRQPSAHAARRAERRVHVAERAVLEDAAALDHQKEQVEGALFARADGLSGLRLPLAADPAPNSPPAQRGASARRRAESRPWLLEPTFAMASGAYGPALVR